MNPTLEELIDKKIDEIVELELTSPTTDWRANWQLVELDAELDELQKKLAEKR